MLDIRATLKHQLYQVCCTSEIFITVIVKNEVMPKYLPAFPPNVIYSSVWTMLKCLKRITISVFVMMIIESKYLQFISDVRLQSSNWVGFDIQAGTSPSSESYENYFIMNVCCNWFSRTFVSLIASFIKILLLISLAAYG